MKRTWELSWLSWYWLLIAPLALTGAALQLTGSFVDRLPFFVAAIAALFYLFKLRGSTITIDDERICLRWPYRSWTVQTAEIICLDKVRGDRITGLYLITASRRVRFGLTYFRDCQSLAATLLDKLEADRISDEAATLLHRIARSS